jgi:hypothetical protein
MQITITNRKFVDDFESEPAPTFHIDPFMRHLHKPTLNTIDCSEVEKPRTAQTTRNLGNRVRTFGAV